MSLTCKKLSDMQQMIYFLSIVYCLSGCNKRDEDGPYYLKAAAEHCDCRQSKLKWLQEIVTSGDYPTPGAKLPAPIRRISLSSSGNTPLFLLDSDINACFNCPWAVLNCKGEPFISNKSSSMSVSAKGKIIWER